MESANLKLLSPKLYKKFGGIKRREGIGSIFARVYKE